MTRFAVSPQRRRFWHLCAILAFLAAAANFAAILAKPCPTEDSRGCTWYAASQGNGLGRSFTDLGFATIYWP